MYRQYFIGFGIFNPDSEQPQCKLFQKQLSALLFRKKMWTDLLEILKVNWKAKDRGFKSWRFNIFYAKIDS